MKNLYETQSQPNTMVRHNGQLLNSWSLVNITFNFYDYSRHKSYNRFKGEAKTN